MTGLEMMFSKLLGLEPEHLKKMALDFVGEVKSINERLGNIESKVTELHNLTLPESAEAKDGG
jgi:hypothetical protein